MAKPPKKPKPEEVETVPDGWERFQKNMDMIVPPKRKPRDSGDETKKPGR